MEEYLYNQELQSIRYGGISANEMREYMALIDKRTEVRTLILNANWFGLELPFRYYPCWLERLDWPMGYVYDPLNFERQEA